MRIYKQKIKRNMRIALVMVSAATMLVCLVIMGATSYFSNKEMEQSSLSILRQNINQTETMLDTLDRLMVDFVANNGTLNQFMIYPPNTALDEYKMYRQLDRYLETIQKLYPSGVSTYINAPKTRKLYLDGRPYHYDDFGHMAWVDEAFAYEKLNQWMGARSGLMFQGHERFATEEVVYVMRNYATSGGNEYGTVAMYLDTQLIKDILRPSLPTMDSQMYILAQDDRLVTAVGDNYWEHLDSVLAQGSEGGWFSTKPNICQLRSPYTGWRYVLRVPRSRGYTLMNTTGTVLIVGVFVYCILVSVIWTLWFMYPYRAISRMVEQLQESVTSIHTKPVEMGELLYLRTVFNQLINQGNRLRQELDVYKPAMYKQLVSDLLRPGRIESFPEYKKQLEGAGIYIHDRSFVVILIRSVKNSRLCAERIYGVLSEFRNHDISAVGVEREDDGVAIVLTCSSLLEKGTVNQLISAILARASHGEHESYAVGVGSITVDYMGIPVSYRAAKLALDHCLLLEGQGIVEYAEIERETQKMTSGFAQVSGEVNGVMDALSSTDAAALVQTTDTLYAKMAELRFTPSMVKSISSQLIYLGMELSDRFDLDLSVLIREFPDGIIYTMEERQSLSDIEAFVLRVLMEMRKALEYRKSNVGSARLAQRIISYLDRNYTDTQMCVNSLADQFGVTPAHISRVFKENTGLNLSVYLMKLRIERAKTLLLEERNLPLSVVAEQVGYANVQTFMRAFKKETGIPPGSYKQEFRRSIEE